MFSRWRNVWRAFAACELIGFVVAGLLASVQFAALHVTWVYLVHNPDLVLRIGSSFLTDSLIAGVLLVALLLTIPVLVVSEMVSMRGSNADREAFVAFRAASQHEREARRGNAQRVD